MLAWVAFGKLPVLVSASNLIFWRQIMEKVVGDKYIQRGDPNACLLVERFILGCKIVPGSGAFGVGRCLSMCRGSRALAFMTGCSRAVCFTGTEWN